MRRTWFMLFLLAASMASFSQTAAKLPDLDKSPMDMSYFPVDYPVKKIGSKPADALVARIIYSRPQKQGRKVFGELIEYGKVWRLGANEATEIEFYKEVKVGGKRIPKGRYTLYAIPYESNWTFILNKDTDIWGAFKYDPKKDVVRLDAAPVKTEDIVEALTLTFEQTDKGANLVVAWEQVRVALPLQF